jgi:hypothetical protein
MIFEVRLEGFIDRAKLGYDRCLDNRPLVTSTFSGHAAKTLPKGQGLFSNVAGSAKQPGLRGMPGRPQSLLNVHAESPCVQALQGRPLSFRDPGAGTGRFLEG